MKHALTNLALAGVLAFLAVQSLTASAQQPQKTSESDSAVGPAQPVITVHGLCGEGARQGKDDAHSCTTVITREEFETLMQALNPEGQPIPPNARQNLGKTYTEMLAVEAAARKAGLEDTPQFRQLIAFVRLRTVTDLYRRTLQEKYGNPSQEEIDGYYKQHLADFERADLSRILVPRQSLSAPDKSAFDKKALEAAKTARERAAKGEDPAQVQKDAYTALGLGEPPSVSLGKRGRADMIANEAAEIFSLRQGEVTQVQTEPKNYVIYKLLAKETLPEENIRVEIVRNIYQQKFKDAMKSVLDATPADMNEQYFWPAAATPQPPPAPNRPPIAMVFFSRSSSRRLLILFLLCLCQLLINY